MFRSKTYWGAVLLVALAMALPRNLPAQVLFLGSESIANTTTANSQQNPASAVDSSGHIFLVWESYATDGDDYGIYATVFNSDGTTLISEFKVNATTANGQRFPSIAATNSGNFVVTWMSEAQDGDGWGVYARRYSISGSALSGEVLVNADSTSGDQKFPNVAMNANGDYIITWMSNSTGDFDISAKQYDNAGTAITGEYTVNTYTTDYQGYPRAALRSDGYGMVVWQSKDQDGSGNGVYAQRVSPSSTLVGSEFVVNTDTSGNQQEPDIAMNSQGETVIAWSSYGQDGDREGIYARKYDSTGSATTSPFLVNTYTTGVQSHAVVSISDSSQYAIAWNSYGEDGSFDGVYMQAYSANDASFGGETLVNTRTTDFQQFPDIAFNPSNFNLVAVWQDGLRNDTATHDGDDYGIYFNRLSVEDTTPPTAICQNITVYLNSAGNATLSASDVDGGSSDNSGSISLSVSPSSFTCNDIGTQTATLTVSDAAGNSSTCTATITVLDTVSPVAVCQSISVYLDGSGNATITSNDIDNGSSDNCSTVSTSVSSTSFTCNELGANNVTLTATDGSGNTATCSGTVTVIDSTAPTAVCQNISVHLSGGGSVTITATDIDNGSTNNCATVTLSTSATSFTCSEVGANTVTLTATDGSGNSRSCTSTVTVIDSVTPTAICQNITMFLNGAGNATISGSDIDGGSTDNCSPITYSASTTSFTCNEIGSNTVTLTVTDPSGNSASCSGVVTITDSTSPTAVCQNISVYLDGSGNATITANDIDNGSTDNCSTVSLSATPTSFTCNDLGTNTVVLTVTDGSGNTRACSGSVTVIDSVSPTASCQSISIFLDGSGNATITANDIDNGSADNCSTVSLSASPTAFTCSNVGSNSVTLTATDGSGNTSTCTSTVTVIDSTAPTALCQNITVYLDGSGNATITGSDIDGGSTDNCTTLTYGASAASFTCNDIGTVSVTLTVTDPSSNTASCSSVVTITDSTAPSALCQSISVYLDGSGNATITANDIDNGSTDNCGSPTLGASATSFTCNEIGNNAVVLTATDGSGNTSSCSSTVTVIDSTAPTAACQSISVHLDGTGNATITTNDIDNGSTDNCGTPTLSASVTAFTCSDVGANAVTLTATDGSGNTSSCSSTVTVIDSTAPAAVCQNITLFLDGSGNAALVATDIDGGSTDNCSPLTYTASASSFTCNDIGTATVTLTVTDPSSNASTCTSVVTIADTTAPSAVCNNATVQLDSTGNAVMGASVIGASSTDNCGIMSATVSQGTFNCGDIGTVSVTLTVTDSSGNASSCTATVTVEDVTPPVVVCNNATVSLDSTGNATLGASVIGLGTADACTTFTSSLSQSSFTCNDIGANTVTFTATDAFGNAASCTAIVTVQDSIAPTAVCASPTLYLDGSGNASLLTGNLNGGSTDNCTIATVSVSNANFTCNDAGTNSVTLTVTDGSGNASTCTGIVTVLDTLAPSVTCQNITVYLDANGQYSLTTNEVDGGTSDNCTNLTLAVSPSTFDCNSIGLNFVTLTATDNSSNSSNCTAGVTVADTLAPSIVCQNITVYLDGLGSANITANDIDGGTTDNCSLASTSASVTAFSCNDVGTVSVVLTATDVNGNSSTCTSIVTVTDSIAPVASCQSLTLYLDGTGNALLNAGDLDNGSTDACSPLIYSASASGFNCGDIGIQTVTLTVSDPSGNASTCTTTVTVIDSIAPSVVCNTVNVYLDGSGQATLTAGQVGAGTTDNCGFTEVIDLTSFTCNDLSQVQTVNYTATDFSGNIASCTATILVGDSIAPTLVCQNDTVYLDSTGNGSTTLNQILASLSDNCGILTSSASQLSFTTSDIGVNTVTISAVDSNANVGSCTSLVTVIDTFATSIDPGFLAGDGLIWQAWPNPAFDQVNVEIACGTCLANGEYVLELTEMSGKVLLQRKIVLSGNSAQVTLDLRPYASGVMALTLKNGNGSQTKRIVKM